MSMFDYLHRIPCDGNTQGNVRLQQTIWPLI